MKKRKKSKQKKILLACLWALFLLALGVFIFCVVAIIFTIQERKAARAQYAEMQALYETAPQPEGGEAPEETLDETKWYAAMGAMADKRIDFAALTERNPDVCAWVSVEDTPIDYPVLRAEGKEVFYLTHDIDRTPSEHGTACLDVRCARDFSDRVTVLYGHNMKDGSMFAPLYRYYKDAAFFDGDPLVHIYLDNAVLTYRVVAAYEYGYEHPLFYYDMTDDGDFAAYCATFLQNRDMKARIRPVEIGPEDHLLTLITSTNVRADQRLFVQAVLIHG